MTKARARRITSYVFAAAVWVPLAVLLSACATPSPVAEVAASEAALAAAGRVVLACYAQPRCNAAAPKAEIKTQFDITDDALTAAQRFADAGGLPDLTAAAASLAALQMLVVQLPQN